MRTDSTSCRSIYKALWMLTAAVLTFSASALAEPICDKYPTQDAAVSAALKLESKCMKSWWGNESKITCLDQVTDIYWHCIGDYAPMIRIENVQLGLKPKNLDKRFDLMSNIAWLSYSIEDDKILNHVIPDFTLWTEKVYADHEAQYLSSFYFYHEGANYPMLIVLNRQLGSEAAKRVHYALFKRFVARAQELFPQLESSGISTSEIEKLKLQMRSHQKALERYKQYDAS